MNNRRLFVVLAAAVAALTLPLAGCGGDEAKTLKIVSDLPLQGATRAQTESMVNAIELYLEQVENKAGDYTIEYESFDDATAAKGAWDEAVCASNARTYVDDDSIVGVIGTFNSGCAKIQVPIANEASLAYVSPANTAVGLTHEGPGSEPGEPDKYYPTGTRNYTRVVASDDYQGAVGANFMKEDLQVTKVFILDDKDAYGKGVADAFEIAANEIGLEVVGHEGWDANASNYTALMTKIKATGADGIYIGGIADFNGGQLIKDKVAVVGDNDAVKMLGSDGFVIQGLFEQAGEDNMQGMYGSAPVLNPEDLTGAGADFIASYEEAYATPEVYTAYAAAAAQALLDAISRSDGSREDVVAKLFETDITDGIVGPMSFDENGDPEAGQISVFQAQGTTWAFQKAVATS